MPVPGGEARLTRLGPTLQRVAELVLPRRESVLAEWARAVSDVRGLPIGEAVLACTGALESFLLHLSTGDVDALLHEQARLAEQAVRHGASLVGPALEIRVLDRCLATVLGEVCPDRDALVELLLALDELGDRRMETLLLAQEDESTRRLVGAQRQAAHATERAREVQRSNEALRRAEAESRYRAEQLRLLSSVAHRIAPIRDPEELMQQAADQIRARMNHTYVAVLVLDPAELLLVGRWAGRPTDGVARFGPARGPVGGIIGRAIRTRAPQVVGEVKRDPDYFADVQGTRSEMAIPLLEGAAAIGVLDFQSPQPFAFALDDVAAGETLSELIVIALRNARLHQEAHRRGGSESVP